MNELPEGHVMKDREVQLAEGIFQRQVTALAESWIDLKKVRLRKMFQLQHNLGTTLSTEYQKLEHDFIKQALLDPDFQTGAVNDDICARIDEEISNQVNERYSS